MLHADKLKYDNIVKGLRAVAQSWGHGTDGYEEVVSVLNLVKEEAFNYSLTATRAWMLVKSVLHYGKHITRELISFMENLENNGIMHYTLFIEKHEPNINLIPGINFLIVIYEIT